MKQRSQNIQWDIFQYLISCFVFGDIFFVLFPSSSSLTTFSPQTCCCILLCMAAPRYRTSISFVFLSHYLLLSFLIMTVEPKSPLFCFLITFFCLFSWYKHLFLSFFISRRYWVNVKKKTWNSDLEILIGLCWDIFEILNRCMVEVAKVLMCLYFVLTILFVTQWGHRSSSITNSPAWLMFQSLPSHFV